MQPGKKVDEGDKQVKITATYLDASKIKGIDKFFERQSTGIIIFKWAQPLYIIMFPSKHFPGYKALLWTC